MIHTDWLDYRRGHETLEYSTRPGGKNGGCRRAAAVQKIRVALMESVNSTIHSARACAFKEAPNHVWWSSSALPETLTKRTSSRAVQSWYNRIWSLPVSYCRTARTQ